MIPEGCCIPLDPGDEWRDYIAANFTYSGGKVFRAGKKKPIGTKDKDGYLTTRLRAKGMGQKSLKVSHISWFLNWGVWPEMEIDHENKVRDDNRVENLRCVSRRDNLRNRRERSLNPF